MLLQAGADPESSTDLGMTPSDVVCEWVSADKDRRSNVRELLKSTPQEMAKVRTGRGGHTADDGQAKAHILFCMLLYSHLSSCR